VDLRDNPFFVLGATPRDDRRRILALADEKSLLAAPDAERAIAEARATLTNPGKRLVAEVAWLPGLAPQRAAELLLLLREKPWHIPFQQSLPQLARLNLLAAALREAKRFLRILLPEHVADLIAALCAAHAAIDAQRVLADINADRQVAGFGAIDDVGRLAPLLEERRRHAERAINRALAVLAEPPRRAALTRAVATATADGSRHGPELLEDIVDGYEAAARQALDQAAAEVARLVQEIGPRVAADARHFALEGLATQLEQAVNAWDTIAQPIQLCARSRGVDHEPSRALAWQVRDLALTLHNEHGRTDLSLRLTRLLGAAFAEVDPVAERVADDAEALEQIAAEQQMAAALDPLRSGVLELLARLERLLQRAGRGDALPEGLRLELLAGIERFADGCVRLAAGSEALDGPRERFALEVRGLVVDLVNAHGCIDLARTVVARLKARFGDLAAIGEKLDQDLAALDNLRQIHAEQQRREADWRRDIAYEARIGLLRTKLAISADGIAWQGRHWRLDDIDLVRWGGIGHSINGIPTGTTYRIAFGSHGAGFGQVELAQEQVFEAFVERLWKSVGVRLLGEMLAALRDGRRYDFGAAVVDDRGCVLTHRRLFGADERHRLDWRDVGFSSRDGMLVIAARRDNRLSAGLSYLEQNNVHVLEAALRTMAARGGTRLSCLLDAGE
jgi:hypothetical protein